MKTSRETWTYLVIDRRTVEAAEERSLLDELETELDTQTGLLEDEDYEGLVDHLERIVARRPDDAYALKDLGEAYVLAGQPEKALELLGPLHRRAPQFEDPQWVILDALFALGRDERGFDWVERPEVVRLDSRAIEACRRYLVRHGPMADVRDLYSELLGEGYAAFSERELLEALRADELFEVAEDWVVGLKPSVDQI